LRECGRREWHEDKATDRREDERAAARHDGSFENPSGGMLDSGGKAAEGERE
jgi:hypothetical protein